MSSITINIPYFRRDPKDTKILAQLIAAYSKFDAKKAQLYPLYHAQHYLTTPSVWSNQVESL